MGIEAAVAGARVAKKSAGVIRAPKKSSIDLDERDNRCVCASRAATMEVSRKV